MSTNKKDEIIQAVFTDKNGRYQLDNVKPGKYIVRPEQSGEEQNQIFKPQNRTITVEIGQKTNVAGF